MSHTLHRTGTLESLKNDFIVFVVPEHRVNAKDSCCKIKEFFDLCVKHGCISIAERRKGHSAVHSIEVIKDAIKDGSNVYSVFNDRKKVRNLLVDLKESELGLSIITTGVVDEVLEMCREIGITPHSINRSFGLLGNLEDIPSGPMLDLITMCGHMVVSKNLINAVLEDIKKGRITLSDGAKKLAEPCVCGVYNVKRAEELLALLISQE